MQALYCVYISFEFFLSPICGGSTIEHLGVRDTRVSCAGKYIVCIIVAIIVVGGSTPGHFGVHDT